MDAVLLGPGDGETLAAPNAPTVVHKVRGEATGGRLAIVDYVVPHRFAGPAMHRHEFEESFYVLEGNLRLRVGDEEAELAPGAFAHVPGGVAHSFWNPSDRPARFLITMAPAGFERFFEEAMAEARKAGGVPPPDVMARLNAAHGVEVVGPPPGAG
ncbi:MAG: cupin domain-containing protein [Actinomycetota bacterium]|nr:cupin domain-containing protein [Actinomycetota bacterium]